MTTSKATLKYIDDEDRCYGLTGMAMGIVIWDCEELLAAINLDADPDEMMEFTPQFYFAGNPKISARIAWNQILEHYRLSMGLMMANVLCRNYVHSNKQVESDTITLMRKYLLDEGRETCSLDEDEVNALFNKQFSYLERLFNHPGVRQVANDFARDLSHRRRMTVSEVIEGFRPLALL